MIRKRAYHPEGKPSSCEPKVGSFRSCSAFFEPSHGLDEMILQRHKGLGIDEKEKRKGLKIYCKRSDRLMQENVIGVRAG